MSIAAIPQEIQDCILTHATNGWFDCIHYHSGSCADYALTKFIKVMYSSTKIYLPIHLIPLLLYKRNQIRNKPISTLCKATLSFIKSVCFVSLMASLLIYVLCREKNRRRRVDGLNPFNAALVGSLGLLLETHGRRQEVMLFLLPRGLEVFIGLLRKYKYLPHIQYADVLLYAAITATLHYYYQHQNQTLKPTVKSALALFWGHN